MYKSEHIITSKHYLILVSLSFLAGVFISLSMGVSFAFGISVVFFSIGIFTGLILFFTKAITFKKKYILLPIFLIIFFILGVLRVLFIDISSDASLRKYQGEELWLYGTVSSEPEITKSKYYKTFELDVFRANDDFSVSDTIIVYLPSTRKCNFHIGDDIFFWGSLNAHTQNENASLYEYYSSLRGRNIFLTASTKNINILSDYNHFSFKSSTKFLGNYLRTKISDASKKLFPSDPESVAILNGILIGDKSGFTDEMYNKFSNSGISHIVAVSGLHISILFSFLMVILGLLGLNRKIVLLITMPFIVVFMAASSFSPSVLRASLMVFIMIFASILNEEYHPLTALFLAFSIIVSFAPYSIMSKGLVLSFSATFGILVFFPYFYNALTHSLTKTKESKNKYSNLLKRPIIYLMSSFSLSLSSLLGTSYFLLLFFGKISKVQFLTNLWIIPLVSVIFCLGYLAAIFIYIFPGLSFGILVYPLKWCIELIKLTTNIFGENKFAFNFPFDISSPRYAIIYFGSLMMIYMFLKTFHDIYKQKQQP